MEVALLLKLQQQQKLQCIMNSTLTHQWQCQIDKCFNHEVWS